jgi:hypothetical protein
MLLYLIFYSFINHLVFYYIENKLWRGGVTSIQQQQKKILIL